MSNVNKQPLVCKDCGNLTTRTSNRQIRCLPCKGIVDRSLMKEYHKKTYVRKGYTRKGENHHNYKNGIGYYKKLIKSNCEFCDVATINLCVHHIDEDRTNNKLDNLATLCRACHVLVHGVIDRKDLSGRFSKKEITNGHKES